MKISLALGSREGLSRQTARGCLATNLALPGFGSLMAGRVVGYAQALLTVAGFAVTMLWGVKFFVWYLANWSKLNGPEADPIQTMTAVWLGVRWALLGIAVFGVSWLWALATSMAILRSVPKTTEADKPPRLA